MDEVVKTKTRRPAVYEQQGVWAGSGEDKGWVSAGEEKPGVVRVSLRGFSVLMTSDDARTLASQLRAIAKRADNK